MLKATPYTELNTVLNELVTRARQILGPDFIGAYLLGSFAVGDFDEDSDADWLFLTRTPLNPDTVQRLQVMHAEIHRLNNPWAQYLEGSYWHQSLLNIPFDCETALWYLDNGSDQLRLSTHDNTLVERSVLQTCGIALKGPPAQELLPPVPVDDLRTEMCKTSLDWAAEILENPQSINSHFYQSFAVLHFCRAYHDIQAGAVHSKRLGAEWTKKQIPEKWHGLIDRAWSGRPQPELSSRRAADPQELALSIEFIRLITTEIKNRKDGSDKQRK